MRLVEAQVELSLLEAVFAHISDGVIVINSRRELRWLNPAAQRLTGIDPSQCTSMRCGDLLRCRDDEGTLLTAATCPCVQVLTDGAEGGNFPLLVQDATLHQVPMNVSATPVPLPDEDLIAIVLRDDRARHRASREQELLYQVARSLASVANFEQGVRQALDIACLITGAQAAAWAERDDRTGQWNFRAISGMLPQEGTQRFFPLEGRQGSLGALVVAARDPLPASAEEMLGAVAAHLATAVENAYLYDTVQSQAVALERQRLAAEMHDSLAQTLGIMGRQVKDLARSLSHAEGPAASLAGMLERAVDQAQREVRAALFDLKAPLGNGDDFLASLGEYLEEFGLQHGLEVRLDTQPSEPLFLPLTVEVQVLRIIQEALTNVRRHARAQLATVALQQAGSLLTVRIKDDGIGFDTSRRGGRMKGHFGLSVMQERAKAAGGLLTIRSMPGAGTLVQLELPLGG